MEEELSVATSSTLSLLAALYSPPAVIVPGHNLAVQLPIVWPLLTHNLTSVRLAAATCLSRIVAARGNTDAAAAAATAGAGVLEGINFVADGAAEAGSWLQPVVGPCLRLLLQSLVLEKVEAVQQMLHQAWQALLQHSRAADVAAGLAVRDMRAMLNVLCTPCGHAVETSGLVIPLQGRLAPWSSQDSDLAGPTQRATKRAKPSTVPKGMTDGVASRGSWMSSGEATAGVAGCGMDPEGWPGMSDVQAATHTRLLASRAMAELCDKLADQVC